MHAVGSEMRLTIVVAVLFSFLGFSDALMPRMLGAARRATRLVPPAVSSRLIPMFNRVSAQAERLPLPASRAAHVVSRPFATGRSVFPPPTDLQIVVRSLSGKEHYVSAPADMTLAEFTAALAQKLNYDLVFGPEDTWIELTLETPIGDMRVNGDQLGSAPIGSLVGRNPHFNCQLKAKFFTRVLVDFIRDPYLFDTIETMPRSKFLFSGRRRSMDDFYANLSPHMARRNRRDSAGPARGPPPSTTVAPAPATRVSSASGGNSGNSKSVSQKTGPASGPKPRPPQTTQAARGTVVATTTQSPRQTGTRKPRV